MKKRFLPLVLAIVMVMLLTVPASATEESSGVLVESSEGMIGNELVGGVALELEEEDLIISKEVAGYIAEFFICDMIETEQTCWDDSTAIVDTTLMYDETGERVTGYSFKLTDGYIVISAYVDLSNPVLEWSDVGNQVYEEADMESEDKVVYLSVLDYYIDTGESDLETVDGDSVPRDELTNGFEEQRSIEHVNEDVLSAIIEAKEETSSPLGISTFAADNNKGGYITDPITYAKNVYGGTWAAFNWVNNWESYTNFSTATDFQNRGSGYVQHCGPTAITNIIKMYGKKYNHATIKSYSAGLVFDKVIEANKNSVPPIYINSGNGTITDLLSGTSNAMAYWLIEASFQKFNVNVSTDGRFGVNYSNTVITLGATNRLMYIMTNRKDTAHPYGYHAIVGYAYTRLMDQNGVGRAFIKVCDGHKSSARYVEIDAIAGAGAQYWEVHC